ncbi:MAG: metallophosphoesterase family protein [Clostridia bacterium]|nr:metallophosphoesterase family protein [Clostridia bacterium]
MVVIKVAIISDIHGNSIALEEVLKDAKLNGVDEYIFSGDLVNDLPFGNKTLEIVKNTTDKVLKGNKEQYLIEFEQEKYNWSNIQFKNTKFMYEELTEENRAYIRNLPHCMEISYEGVNLLVAHGSPKSVEELLNQWNTELIEKYVNELQADALIFGHTHEKMWYKEINGKLVLNAGCTGVSPYYIGKAEYVILTINNGKIENIDLRLVDYDIELVKQKIIESGILNEDKVLMNLTFCGMNGNGLARHNFFKEAKMLQLERYGKWYQDEAKGIYKYFKLYDDDIWLGLARKYDDFFVF